MSNTSWCRAAIVSAGLMVGLAGCNKPAPVATAETPPAPAAPQPSALDIGLLPSLHYAGVVYEPKSGVISPGTDVSASTVRLELQATAPSRAEVPLDGQLTLEFANGSQLRTPARGLGAAEVRDVSINGTVPAGTAWAGATLTLSESGKPPGRVAVGSPAPSDEIALAPGPEVTAPTHYGEAVKYSVAKAALLLDGPLSGGFYARTSDAQRFLRVVVTTLNQAGKNGVSIGQESFELWADGQSTNLAVGMFARTVAYNQSNDFELWYRVPVEAKSLVLKVGADGRKPGQIELGRAP